MVRDWTLSVEDKAEIGQYRRKYRLFIAIQLSVVRLYGRFFREVYDLSPHIVTYLNTQLELPPTLTIEQPTRPATLQKYQQDILSYLGFRRFDEAVQTELSAWIESQAKQGVLPQLLFDQTEQYLFDKQILLPGPSTIERLIVHLCTNVHAQIFATISQSIPVDLRKTIDEWLTVSPSEQRSFFDYLKAYPPTAKISSLKTYLQRYHILAKTGINTTKDLAIEPTFQHYLFQLAKKYSAKEIKRFNQAKRYALMICFLLETQKLLLDHLVTMHDQYITDICRRAKNEYEKKHRFLRKRQKKAVDITLKVNTILMQWAEGETLEYQTVWQQVNKDEFEASTAVLLQFQQLTERGYGDLLVGRYPTLRKYFADFIKLPFAVGTGSEPLMEAITLVRQLDTNQLKRLPQTAPTAFVPKELRLALINDKEQLNRNAWEMGLALALKDALRSGDVYLPQSQHHVSFWNFMMGDTQWESLKSVGFTELQQPQPTVAIAKLTTQFHDGLKTAQENFPNDAFAQVEHGKLKLQRDDKAAIPSDVAKLQRLISATIPSIRIEQLLMEVDQLTHFTQQFIPIQPQKRRPKQFYKTLIASIISQATNLGVMAMSASVKDVSVDMLRHVNHFFIREETLIAANTQLVNQHHLLPLSAIHGSGNFSSSDAQRFGIRTSSLLASYYPRYYGYYQKAIGIYTHVSDQYSVFSTKVISCSPREALYVLDGLLENNTILQLRKHTTDTHGYTEIVFALCYLLGYEFMPRIRDLKDQQLYRIDKSFESGLFTPLLNKTVDTVIIEEQWEAMIRVAFSLKKRTVPAHVVVPRLTNSYPADRLSKAFTNLGRIIKTQYILRYLTQPDLRRTIQRQLNKGEYRHKLPRWIFFANQGEFTTGDYEEIMNKASCLSLVSNAILYWNTIKINDIIQTLKRQGQTIDDDTLAHISLLPFKHVLPNGTYFIDDL